MVTPGAAPLQEQGGPGSEGKREGTKREKGRKGMDREGEEEKENGDRPPTSQVRGARGVVNQAA